MESQTRDARTSSESERLDREPARCRVVIVRADLNTRRQHARIEERACEWCCGSLAGKRAVATFCSDSCAAQKAKHQRRKKRA